MEKQSWICFYFYHLDFLWGNDLHSTPLRSTLVDRAFMHLLPTMKGKGVPGGTHLLTAPVPPGGGHITKLSELILYLGTLTLDWVTGGQKEWLTFPLSQGSTMARIVLQDFLGSFPVILWFPEATLTMSSVSSIGSLTTLLTMGNLTLFC